MSAKPKSGPSRTSASPRAAAPRNAAHSDTTGARVTGATNTDAKQSGETRAADDVALVWGKTEDGGVNILRKRKDRIEAGTLLPLREGRPIQGEVVQLHAREGSPLYDVEVHVPAAAPALPSGVNGPPQVATDTYRKNWDSIYKRSSKARGRSSALDELDELDDSSDAELLGPLHSKPVDPKLLN